MKINLELLTETDEFKAILDLEEKASNFLKSFNWCKEIKNSWYDQESGVYEKIGVFLFEIDPINDEVDSFLWIVIGDLPTVYLDQSVESGNEALTIYCELMEEWANNVKEGKSIRECYPVKVSPTIENAEFLISRTEFIRQELIIK